MNRSSISIVGAVWIAAVIGAFADADAVCCETQDCSNYRGNKKTTASGRDCQPWNSDVPHKRNKKTKASMESAGLSANYCRNPTNGLTAWCYTMDEDKRWEYCDIPKCSEPTPGSPIVITDSNWRQLDKGEWLIEFYAPWCPFCQELEPRWDQLARDVKDLNEVRVHIAKCDVTKNPWLKSRMRIKAFPSIFHIKEKEYRRYFGARSTKALYDYLLKKKWQDTPVLENWRASWYERMINEDRVVTLE